MTWDNVDAAKGLIMFLQKKTEKIVVVPMHARLIKHLHHVQTSNWTPFRGLESSKFKSFELLDLS